MVKRLPHDQELLVSTPTKGKIPFFSKNKVYRSTYKGNLSTYGGNLWNKMIQTSTLKRMCQPMKSCVDLYWRKTLIGQPKQAMCRLILIFFTWKLNFPTCNYFVSLPTANTSNIQINTYDMAHQTTCIHSKFLKFMKHIIITTTTTFNHGSSQQS